MSPGIQNAGFFLIDTIFNFAIFIVLLRVLLQLVKANFYNPVTQGIVKITDPILGPIRRFVPDYKGIDTASVLFLLALEIVKYLLLWSFFGAGTLNIFGLLIAAIAGILYELSQLYFYLIIIVVLMSWVNPATRHPIAELLSQLTEPLLQPARRMLPAFGGFDLSPIVVLIVLKVITYIVIAPLQTLAGIG
jgi:YggT family protein